MVAIMRRVRGKLEVDVVERPESARGRKESRWNSGGTPINAGNETEGGGREMQCEKARSIVAPIGPSTSYDLCLGLRIFIGELRIRNTTPKSVFICYITNETTTGSDRES